MKDESAGLKAVIKPQGDTVVVSIGSGLDRTAGPKRKEKAKKPDRGIRQITRQASSPSSPSILFQGFLTPENRPPSNNRAAGGAHGLNVVARMKASHNYTARNARELSFRVRGPPLCFLGREEAEEG